ncbi:MAG TPA: hypothetical protein VG986_05040 [Pseudolabrys sp.]|nr:hypothetical protein [Pseudolabrys sp.]
MSKAIDKAGFTPPSTHPLGRERRTATIAELVTTVALALSTLVAATAVSIGIARADVLGGAIGKVAGGEAGLIGTALLMGFVFVVMGGIAALRPPSPRTIKTPPHD